MSITRRTFLLGSAAAAATGAVGASAIARAALHARATGIAAVSGPGDVVGKVTVGYQGWFAAPGDGAPINGWWHWAHDWGRAPNPDNNAIKSWPDMREYASGYQTDFAPLRNGAPARLFSSYDQDTVNVHFHWMQQHGIDTAALQRFNPVSGEGPTRDAMAANVRQAAERYQRKFYIMYDVSGWTQMRTQMKEDWSNKMSALTASPAYARQNGKPVVCIWGFGFDDDSRPFHAAECADVVAWFKRQGCYVIGGVPTRWRTGDSVRPGFLDVFNQFDMLSPWMIGAIGKLHEADAFWLSVNIADKDYCDAHGIDYQPCVLPGDLAEHQRAHGNFMWRQFYNLARLGVAGFYISMFDEYNEGNQIAKTAETANDLPVNFNFAALDEDGTPCASDYYLRLTGDGGRMLKGALALTPVRPTAPVSGSTVGQATVLSLRSRVNNRYVVAESGGGQALIANRDAIGPWERFDMVDAGGGDVALLSHANAKFVTVDAAQQNALIANRDTVGARERFFIEVLPGGTIALRARANNRYVTATNEAKGPLIPTAVQVGGWELFDLVIS
ncbi:hypothetical protein [Lysobacter capsici]|uniref:DUF7910 domain-containing protein n=1 Tax=Lysobacter capsici TaxID=435897 RepID=UPI001C000D11|nr:hypothetical protein [Lysobacter capsici]QWF17740.1 hypothetical protein KME82_02795 [Lysobacter capsici]